VTDEPRLRVVGDDERLPEKAGSIGLVLEDVSAAHGYLVEARAEYAECQQYDGTLDALLVRAEDALSKARDHYAR
jgi:hypothetical protein